MAKHRALQVGDIVGVLRPGGETRRIQVRRIENGVGYGVNVDDPWDKGTYVVRESDNMQFISTGLVGQ